MDALRKEQEKHPGIPNGGQSPKDGRSPSRRKHHLSTSCLLVRMVGTANQGPGFHMAETHREPFVFQ
jgi:hypothetical protein